MKLWLLAVHAYWQLTAWSREIEYAGAVTIIRRSRRASEAAQQECERAVHLAKYRKAMLLKAQGEIAKLGELRRKREIHKIFGAL